jgi:autotransporter-associated beta strand protein
MRIGWGNPGVINVTAGGQVSALDDSDKTRAELNDMYVGYTTASQYNQSGGKTNVANNFLIGSGSTVDLSGGEFYTKLKTAANGYTNTPSTNGHLFVGRQGSTNDLLKIRGGALVNIGGRFLLASSGAGGNNSVVQQTGGTVTTGLNLVVADTGGSATYFLGDPDGVANPTLTLNSELSRIGRRGDGKMFQIGGTATFNGGVAIGDDASTAPGETDNATGLYEISGGTLNANLAGDALRIGSAGNGTLRVVGQDGVINVTGNLTSSNTSDGVGNLAYKFQTGESLSQINVTGNATLGFNSGLSMDTSAVVTPASGSTYNLATAVDVIDNGLLVTSPGWTYQIVSGGAGEILQAVKTTPQYWDTNDSTPGAGGASPSGNWDGVATNFSTDSTGSSSTAAVTGFADDVVFAAGSDGTGSYTVTVSGTQTAHAVQVARGNVAITGGTVAVGNFDVASGATGTVSSNVSGDAFGRVIKTGDGTLSLTAANTYTGGTMVNAGKLQVTRLHENNPVTIAGGTLQVVDSSPTFPNHPAGSDAAVSQPKQLTITGTGKLDLGNNDMIVAYGASTPYAGASPAAALEDLIAQGFNGGDWLGTGITSSAAASDDAAGNFVLAIVDNANLPQPYGASNGGDNFDGVDVPLESVLVKFTHRVDLNLDGLVTDADAITFSTNYETGAPAYWAIGDLDYDGVFTDNDAIIFGTFYDTGLAHLPEPASIGMVGIAAAALIRRRRR